MNTQWRHADVLSSTQRQFAESRLDALAVERDDLLDGWIDVAPHSAHHRNAEETVTIRCRARRGEIVAHASHEDLDRALHLALDRFERQTRRMRDRPMKERTAAGGEHRSAFEAAKGSQDSK